jgi:tRNA(Met) C34 N-acetyltransferase TmcA
MQQSAEYDILYFADCYVFIIFAAKLDEYKYSTSYSIAKEGEAKHAMIYIRKQHPQPHGNI